MENTLPDQNHGAVAEYNGNIVNAESNSSATLSTVTSNNLPVYPSITFEAITSEIPDYVNVVDSTDCTLLEANYNKMTNYIDSKWDESLQFAQSLQAYQTAKRLYDYLNNNYLTSATGLPKDIEINNAGLFKCIAWHPHKEVLAVTSSTDNVYLYTKRDSAWTCQVLEHQLMKDIRCIQWKTKASGTLAVGCKAGVCVWTIDMNINYDQGIRYHPAASAKYFEYPECVTALAWDPSPGSQLLAVASSASSTIAIRDVLLNRNVLLKRYGKGHTLLRWSYDGRWLFVGGTSGTSHVWNTDNWSFKRLKNPPGLWVQTACWLPDNMTLLYSMKGKNDIHTLCLSGTTLKNEIWDIKIKAVNAPTTNGLHAIGDICIDSRYGQRIAITFENYPLIGLYNVQISPLNLREKTVFNLIGYLRGAEVEYESNGSYRVTSLQSDAKPLQISFSSSYKYGAILATTWDNGAITFVTHTFKSDKDLNSHII